MRRTVAAAALPLMLVLAGCGGGSDEQPAPRKATIEDVQVKGAAGEKPTLDFKPPVSFASTESDVIEQGPGKGDAVEDTSQITVDYLAINASDGSEIGTTYDDGGQPASFGVDQVVKAFAEGLKGDHAGDRVLITAAPADAYGEAGNGADVGRNTSIIFVVDLLEVSTPLKEATGKKLKAPADVPKLVLDDNGEPSKFKATASTPKQVDKLRVIDVIEGSGPRVEAGQTLTVHYLGQIYPDGKIFDSSWDRGQTSDVVIGQGAVIKAWDKGLVGQRVGSRVILLVPSDLGYGKQGNPPDIGKNADLIFSIDILAAN